MIKFKNENDVEKFSYHCYRIKQLKRSLSKEKLSPEMQEEVKHQMKQLRKKKQELVVLGND